VAARVASAGTGAGAGWSHPVGRGRGYPREPVGAGAREREAAYAPAARSVRRRRPTGAPPPLPHHLRVSGVGWLLVASVLVGSAVAVFANGVRGPAVTVTVVDDAVVRWLAGLGAPGLAEVWQALAHVGSVVTTTALWLGLVLALLVLRRFRHLVVLVVATELVIPGATVGLIPPRPRPFGVVIQTSWGGWALPSLEITVLALTLVGVLYTLVPEGRWRNAGKWVAAGLVALVGLARMALGANAPTDVVVGAAVGVAIPLLGFRWSTPNEVFPVSYRRGRSAHLDVTGARGLAIRRALQDQLGLAVEEVRPFGLGGSAGSTPLRITVQGGPPSVLFGKLYAKSHLRADRWYKLGRELLYGRVEDEKPFNTVRRLVQQEDYALSLMQRAGLPSPAPFGFVEITPEREYLLVAEFFDAAVELGDADVDDGIIDQGISIVRKLWDAGLAHRDIKPANLLVRDGRLLLIDVAFVQARASPWRQAVDLANMMLCLALRSDPERVYQRALRQFSVEEISEAFSPARPAAARSLALPSQLRRLLQERGLRPVRRLRAAVAHPAPADLDPAVDRPPGRAVGRRRAPARAQRAEYRQVVRLLAGRGPGHQDVSAHRQPRLRRSVGAAVAAGPGGALGQVDALRACPADRVDGRRRGRQRRPLGAGPRPRPGRQRRGRGTADRRLRPGRRDRGALDAARGTALPAHGPAARRVLRHLVRPVHRRMRDLPAALDDRPERGFRGPGAGRARSHRPPSAAAGPRRALGRAASARPLILQP
jgi:membrane-associated phospholipid phosphatase/tRNA A-37 threonylcarbamoyl transferase component Bud32